MSRLVRYTAYGVAGLVAVGAVLAAVSALVGLVVSAVTIAVSVVAVVLTVTVLGAVAAAGLAALGGTAVLPSGGESDAEPTDEEDPVERLRRRYMEGEISEAEFERRLDRTIGREHGSGPESGSERERERI